MDTALLIANPAASQFTGGLHRSAVRALRKLLTENYGDVTVNISDDSIYTGALGAALFALRGTTRAPEATVVH